MKREEPLISEILCPMVYTFLCTALLTQRKERENTLKLYLVNFEDLHDKVENDYFERIWRIVTYELAEV